MNISQRPPRPRFFEASQKWTERRLVKGKHGRTPQSIAPILERLSLSPVIGRGLACSFGRKFSNATGRPASIDSAMSRSGQRHDRV